MKIEKMRMGNENSYNKKKKNGKLKCWKTLKTLSKTFFFQNSAVSDGRCPRAACGAQALHRNLLVRGARYRGGGDLPLSP